MNQTFKSFEQFVNESSTEQSKFRIFCDLDGVLVDFDRGFLELPGNPEKLTTKEYEEKHGLNSIWTIIEQGGEDYWINLKWTKDGRELWDYLKRYDPIILSSPSRSQTSITGKTKWVAQNLNIDQEPITQPEDLQPDSRLVLYTDKYKFAKTENDILIDDTEKKLTDWTEAGGTGILHNDATDTIRVVEELMTSQ
jgi:phosphoglycolate phosphatase-like HAD superfamily hydrolase